jgi:hypothetical protein
MRSLVALLLGSALLLWIAAPALAGEGPPKPRKCDVSGGAGLPAPGGVAIAFGVVLAAGAARARRRR